MMRDFRHAKAMAQTLREVLATRRIELKHGEALEIVSRMHGVTDWNTLSAMINGERGEAKPAEADATTMPVLPIKDMVPFPVSQLPLWIRRPKTIEALAEAFTRRREIALVAQKDSNIDEPGRDDVYDVGVIARVVDVGPPSDDVIARFPALESSTQVLLQTQGRALLRNFSGDAGRYEAEVDPIDEGAFGQAPDLIEDAAGQFETYVAAHAIAVTPIWPPLRQLHDAGRVADIIAQKLPLPIESKQAVLATLDPVARLRSVIARMA